ncbi:MAG: hypothetical protein Q9213_004831 [Squamulea squamosa]
MADHLNPRYHGAGVSYSVKRKPASPLAAGDVISSLSYSPSPRISSRVPRPSMAPQNTAVNKASSILAESEDLMAVRWHPEGLEFGAIVKHARSNATEALLPADPESGPESNDNNDDKMKLPSPPILPLEQADTNQGPLPSAEPKASIEEYDSWNDTEDRAPI